MRIALVIGLAAAVVSITSCDKEEGDAESTAKKLPIKVSWKAKWVAGKDRALTKVTVTVQTDPSATGARLMTGLEGQNPETGEKVLRWESTWHAVRLKEGKVELTHYFDKIALTVVVDGEGDNSTRKETNLEKLPVPGLFTIQRPGPQPKDAIHCDWSVKDGEMTLFKNALSKQYYLFTADKKTGGIPVDVALSNGILDAMIIDGKPHTPTKNKMFKVVIPVRDWVANLSPHKPTARMTYPFELRRRDKGANAKGTFNCSAKHLIELFLTAKSLDDGPAAADPKSMFLLAPGQYRRFRGPASVKRFRDVDLWVKLDHKGRQHSKCKYAGKTTAKTIYRMYWDLEARVFDRKTGKLISSKIWKSKKKPRRCPKRIMSDEDPSLARGDVDPMVAEPFLKQLIH